MGKVLKISREIAEVQKLFLILAVILQQLGSSNTDSNDTNQADWAGGEKGGQTFLGADYLAIYLHINHGFQSLEIIVFATLNLLEGNLQLQFSQK